MLKSTGTIQTLHSTDATCGESLMFAKGEIPVIVFGIFFAMLFIFGASSPPTGVYMICGRLLL